MSGDGSLPCTSCGETKPVDAFSLNRSSKRGRHHWCRQCTSERRKRRYHEDQDHAQVVKGRSKRYYHANRQTYLERMRATRARNRELVVEALGGRCAWCGDSERLAIDHVNGDGVEHRKEFNAGHQVYAKLVADNFESDYELQLLCASCHWDKTWPHLAGT